MNECMFTVVKYSIETEIHPLEDLTYVGSGCVIIKRKSLSRIFSWFTFRLNLLLYLIIPGDVIFHFTQQNRKTESLHSHDCLLYCALMIFGYVVIVTCWAICT